MFESTGISNNLKEPGSADMYFGEFTGRLILTKMLNGNITHFLYKKGSVIKWENNKSEKGNSVNEYSDNDKAARACEDYYTCYWSAYCTYRNMIVGTTTYGNGSCNYPSLSPCGYYYAEWEQVGEQVSQQCYNDDPPPPPPGDGDGGNGGGYNFGGTTNYEVFDNECQGLNNMVNRQAVQGGLETAAYYTTDGHMILLPTVGNTPTTVNISFPYRDMLTSSQETGPR
ncbi:hypothetical protein [Hymenobacter elongatus]|uniref:Uncharacterized protein n=1 Tax=Hymenobacter elongatus TaxID=877208 RepID=A0A4Z0PE27_9BACT|nr:hypothetical protein [Hymenobacter elongatus]TGE11284.1 hypothetical protein E5J99_21000 [Hymenobacter elongatus]